MAIVSCRTREEIKAHKMKRFRIATSLEGLLFLVLGIWGEFVFASENNPVSLLISAGIALIGLFLLVMGASLENAPYSLGRAWEIYPAIGIIMIMVSFLYRLEAMPALVFGLTAGTFVFVVHTLCLLATWCRKKHAEEHRY